MLNLGLRFCDGDVCGGCGECVGDGLFGGSGCVSGSAASEAWRGGEGSRMVSVNGGRSEFDVALCLVCVIFSAFEGEDGKEDSKGSSASALLAGGLSCCLIKPVRFFGGRTGKAVAFSLLE